MIDIRSQSLEELQSQFKDWQQPAYRVTQLLDWLYVRRVSTWEAMTNLPKVLRDLLSKNFALYSLELVQKQGSRDTTQKFLWRLNDRAFVECVLIPANPSLYGEASDRHTLCISTQVGCAYGCKFCASGLEGFKRNLQPEEIVNQVLATESWLAALPRNSAPAPEAPALPAAGKAKEAVIERQINNLVIMGMGEPLANYENLMKALTILNAPWGGKIGARKITISTSGLAPQICKLADNPLQFRLAISLHGASDEIRGKIMPVNNKYPIHELTAACEYYQEKKGRMITLEYILIQGVNDGLDQIKPLARMAHRLHAKVNLIAYNPVEGLAWVRPDDKIQDEFLAGLEEEGITVTSRREKGTDIDAACGQLRLKTEKREAAQAGVKN